MNTKENMIINKIAPYRSASEFSCVSLSINICSSAALADNDDDNDISSCSLFASKALYSFSHALRFASRSADKR
jgi:hypothetical protein